MLNFLKHKPAPETSSEAQALVEKLSKEDGRTYPFKLKNFPTGEKILQAEPEFQRLVALALADWLERHRPQVGPGLRTDWQRHWKMRGLVLSAGGRRLRGESVYG